MEVIVGPMPFDHAVRYLVMLKEKSRAFVGGCKPVIGRLKLSYGYKKIIGTTSLDNKVRTRIDYDPFKGYHFNFENDYTGEKICILISDMTKEQYERYIDTISKGRSLILTPKMPNIQTSYCLEERRSDKPKPKEGSYSYEIVDRFKDELFQDKFILDYQNELLDMYERNEIELSSNEIENIKKQIIDLNNNIDYNLSLAYWFIEEMNMDYDDIIEYFALMYDNKDIKKK